MVTLLGDDHSIIALALAGTKIHTFSNIDITYVPKVSRKFIAGGHSILLETY